MKRSMVGLLLAVGLVGCGGASVCDQVKSSQDTFFAGKTECTSSSGGASLTLKRSSATCSTANCSAADEMVLANYASCLGKATSCTTGNESAAVQAAFACASAASGLSESCASNLK